jgi:hypothetical protein
VLFTENPDWRWFVGSSTELRPPKYGSLVELYKSVPLFQEVKKPLDEMFVGK